MSALQKFLSHYDEAALEALTSKGVMLRSKKERDEGKVNLITCDEISAEIKVNQQQVTLTSSGIKAQRCSCPAIGLCHHIVTAMLFLREQPKAVSSSLVEISFEEIEAYAGKEWGKALALAQEATLQDGAESTIILFPLTQERVVFPHAGNLKNAIYKGVNTSRKKLVIAAAALALALNSGRNLPENITVTQSPLMNMDFLDTAEEAVKYALLLLAVGNAAKASDRLLTIGISARAEAAPRLASHFKTLAKRFRSDRALRDQPSELLAGLAQLFALMGALRVNPADPALTGVLKRSFHPSGHKQFLLAGAEHWQTPAGGRGFSLYLQDCQSGDFYRATEARGAGMDPLFSAESCWEKPVFMLNTPNKLIGKILDFKDAALSQDKGLALSQSAMLINDIVTPPPLTTTKAWHQAIRTQTGVGLRRNNSETLALFSPSLTEVPFFDEYRQAWFWLWHDEHHQPLFLRLPEEAYVNPENFSSLKASDLTGLIAARVQGANLEMRLMTLWVKGHDTIYPLQKNSPYKTKDMGSFMASIFGRKPIETPQPAPDRLALLFERTLEALLIDLNKPNAPHISRLLNEYDLLGFAHISKLIQQFVKYPEPIYALRLAYSLCEIRMLIAK